VSYKYRFEKKRFDPKFQVAIVTSFSVIYTSNRV